MQTSFRAMLIGGTGQVGQALLQALLAAPQCIEVLLLCRQLPKRASEGTAQDPYWQQPKLRVAHVDTAAVDFSNTVTKLTYNFASSALPRPGTADDAISSSALTAVDTPAQQGTATDKDAQRVPVVAFSCVGVGRGTLWMPEAQLYAAEVAVVHAFAKGAQQAGVCQFGLLSAAGANAGSLVKYSRVMGQKEQAIAQLGFQRLSIFRPGIIVGNQNTPSWMSVLGRMLPEPWRNIRLTDLAEAFVQDAAITLGSQHQPALAIYDNNGMRQLCTSRT